MKIRDILCMLTLQHDIQLLETEEFLKTIQSTEIDYVYIATNQKSGIDTVRLLPVYVSHTKVFIQTTSQGNYIDYNFQYDAIQAVKKNLNVAFFEHKMMEFSTETESVILSINKHTTYEDIEALASAYDAHISNIIDEVTSDPKFKNQVDPIKEDSFVDKLKNFFKKP